MAEPGGVGEALSSGHTFGSGARGRAYRAGFTTVRMVLLHDELLRRAWVGRGTLGKSAEVPWPKCGPQVWRAKIGARRAARPHVRSGVMTFTRVYKAARSDTPGLSSTPTQPCSQCLTSQRRLAQRPSMARSPARLACASGAFALCDARRRVALIVRDAQGEDLPAGGELSTRRRRPRECTHASMP
jgi:hypothetical protein